MTQQQTALTATLDLELPADQIQTAELDLIEFYLSDLIRAVLLQEDQPDPP